MDRNGIIAELWDSKDLNDTLKKMKPVEIQEDLKSELFLIICEIEENKLVQLYNRKELKFYIVRIMLNIVRSSKNNFYKNYRNFDEYNNEEKPDEQYEPVEIMKYIENLYWYQKEILRLYTFEFNKNASMLSRATGIPYMSIIRTINQIKKDLKKKIRNQ